MLLLRVLLLLLLLLLLLPLPMDAAQNHSCEPNVFGLLLLL